VLRAGARADGTPTFVLVVDASRAPISGIVHVHETMPVSAGRFDFAYPRWVPGEHSPAGPIQNVSGLTVQAWGATLTWTRDLADLNEFHVTVPAGVASIDVDFDYLGSKDGTYGEARLATGTILAINWNQFLMYPQNADIAKTIFAPSLVLPGLDWTAETALPQPSRSGDTVTFAPATLERLVDSPLDAGTAFRRFMLLNAGGFTNEIDAFADRQAELDLDAKGLTGFENVVTEMDAIYGARHWRHYHFLLTLSDEMPGNGVEHGSSSDDGTSGDGLTDPDGVVGTAGLLSHEFNHSWDGKYRRPADLATTNFQIPEQTELLWIYEGMTQFYGDLVPTRAGLWTAAHYRDVLALSYAFQDHEPGRVVRPLIDTAAAAPFLYGAPNSYVSERRTAGDFYAEGELLWLDVYGKLQDLSHGKKSLDGFAHRFFGIENTPPEVNPYTYAQFVAALSAYQPYDWDAYFKSRVYAVAPHPPDPFARLGWKIEYTSEMSAAEKTRQKRRHTFDESYSVGFSANDKGLVSDVLTGSPADKAGLAPSDTIVAIDEREFAQDEFDGELKATQKSTAPLRFIVKRGHIFRTLAVDYHGGPKYPHLVRIGGSVDRLSAILAPHRTNATP
jgi:predicted metalloprotease with PDZ domain